MTLVRSPRDTAHVVDGQVAHCPQEVVARVGRRVDLQLPAPLPLHHAPHGFLDQILRELWLARDGTMANPLDRPLDTVVTASFGGARSVELRVRNREGNEDEAGTPNVREGATHYFIFPGEAGGDAS